MIFKNYKQECKILKEHEKNLQEELNELKQEYADTLRLQKRQENQLYRERQHFAEILLNDIQNSKKADTYNQIKNVMEANNYNNEKNQLARVMYFIHRCEERLKEKSSLNNCNGTAN